MGRPSKRTVHGTSGDTKSPSQGGDSFLFVALNHPQGILFDLPGKRRVLVEGNAHKLRGQEKGKLPIGAFGLTKVAANDWDYIVKTYGGMKIFESGLIFAQGRKDKAMEAAEERAELRHGREPVDPTATLTTEGAVTDR